MSYDRAALEDACRDWVAATTGVALDRVYWAGDEGARPPGQELSVALTLNPRPGRGGFASVSTYPRVLAYPSRSYAISAGALQVPGHGLLTGDGPFLVAGAVAGSYWAIRLGVDALALAADFFAARAAAAVALPASGTGTLAGGPDTAAYLAPADRVRESAVTLELRVEVRGGTAAGATSPGYVLEQLRGAVDARSCPLAVTALGAVQLVGGTVGKVRLEPLAVWTCEVEVSALDSETTPAIERVGDLEVAG